MQKQKHVETEFSDTLGVITKRLDIKYQFVFFI